MSPPHPYDPELAELPQPLQVRGDRTPGGAPIAGPALTDLVVQLARTNDALGQLYRQAQAEARERRHGFVKSTQSDAGGEAVLELFTVPQGATGYLMYLALEGDGATPGTPVTSATMWHAVYGSSDPGLKTFAQLTAQLGGLLDCQPLTPAADAQVPYVYTYGDRYGAPTLVGPGTFYLVVNDFTASRQMVARGAVLVEQPEP